MDRIYGNESGISYCYDNGGVTFYCSDVYTCRDIDMAFKKFAIPAPIIVYRMLNAYVLVRTTTQIKCITN